MDDEDSLPSDESVSLPSDEGSAGLLAEPVGIVADADCPSDGSVVSLPSLESDSDSEDDAAFTCRCRCLDKFKEAPLRDLLEQWEEHRDELGNDDLTETVYRMLQKAREDGQSFKFLGQAICKKAFKRSPICDLR